MFNFYNAGSYLFQTSKEKGLIYPDGYVGQPLPTLSTSPIYMMGKAYERDKESTSSTPSFSTFIQDFSSLLWFSYRKDFTCMENTQFTSDAGWGCMLRSGQMVLGQALVSNLGDKKVTKQEIVRWFADTSDKDAPFSIHAIAQAGVRFGKAIGEWFGPSTIANVLRDLVAAHKPSNLCVYVSDDGAIYIDKVTKLATSDGGGGWTPVLIIIPLRLGLDTMNEIYYPAILETFKYSQSLGIIGGKPRASLYFVAAQDDSVFYLDPHAVQATATVELKPDTYHCGVPKKAHVSEIDPSLALAFYCRDKAQFDDFCHKSREVKFKDATLYTITNTAPDYKEDSGILLGDSDEEVEMDMDMVVL